MAELLPLAPSPLQAEPRPVCQGTGVLLVSQDIVAVSLCDCYPEDTTVIWYGEKRPKSHFPDRSIIGAIKDQQRKKLTLAGIYVTGAAKSGVAATVAAVEKKNE